MEDGTISPPNDEKLRLKTTTFASPSWKGLTLPHRLDRRCLYRDRVDSFIPSPNTEFFRPSPVSRRWGKGPLWMDRSGPEGFWCDKPSVLGSLVSLESTPTPVDPKSVVVEVGLKSSFPLPLTRNDRDRWVRYGVHELGRRSPSPAPRLEIFLGEDREGPGAFHPEYQG